MFSERFYVQTGTSCFQCNTEYRLRVLGDKRRLHLDPLQILLHTEKTVDEEQERKCSKAGG
jgi:hypothetical protein